MATGQTRRVSGFRRSELATAPRWRAIRLAVGAGLLVAGVTFSVGTTAGATATKAPPKAADGGVAFAKAETMAHALPTAEAAAKEPAGYEVVEAGPFIATGGQQAEGVATCPGKEVPVGGGALMSPDGSNEPTEFGSLNSSNPDGSEWHVDVNALATNKAEFDVYAVCIDRAASYSVVTSGPFDIAPDATLDAPVACPGPSVVVGGGAYSYSSSIDTYIDSDAPYDKTFWYVVMANASTSEQEFVDYAICQKQPSGYSQASTTEGIGGNSQGSLAVSCPKGSFPLSGGGSFGQGEDTGPSVTSSFPSSYDWVAMIYNSDVSAGWQLTSSVVCAS